MKLFPSGLFGRLSPFVGTGGTDPLIVHCCHHKVGTVWFRHVLTAVARHYGLRRHAGPQSGLGPEDGIFLEDHSRIDPSALRPFRGSHMIRDPRDVVVSAYFYHLRTTEPWAQEPQEEYGGLGYRAYLQQFGRHEGLLAEIRRSAPTVIADMTRWDYEDPRFLELRYEDLIADERTGFNRLFEFYGFTPWAVATSVKIALGFSLRNPRKKSAHIRSGQPNDWQQHFGPEHRALFKQLTNDAAVTLGYEPDSSW
jgi:hypothetical protein